METLIQTGTDGKILSPEILKIRWKNETITLNNGETRTMDHDERIVRNRMILDKSAKELGPAFESAGIRDEDDVMTLIRELRYSSK